MSSRSNFHQADERRFLDERGTSASVAPNGLNPATIMEKAVRERIIESYFWKEQCFGVNEADIVDRVVDHVSCIGGTTGTSQKPTPFLCLAFKLLQLAPSDEILAAYLSQGGEKFKYLRALALFYVRLTRPAADVFKTLEPFLADKRKLRRKGRAGTQLTFVDDFVDDLLTKSRVCATSLWKLPQREDLEDVGKLEPRTSALGDIDEILDEEDEQAADADDDGKGESGKDDKVDDDDDDGANGGRYDGEDRDNDSDSDRQSFKRRRRSSGASGDDSADDQRRDQRRRTPEPDSESGSEPGSVSDRSRRR
ncbi:prp38 family protein [Ophiostoma piceae UAMH 11346]|uniref:Pre-mRNA-splicing factor 38 n=1 Tax=Ophiostoma piceae (strain UAMH 11346) TaxID=1262450 RepID=S3BY96_OPHP1|nr:prp38 family protein [Ophiostoma piceae UAMH 11346]